MMFQSLLTTTALSATLATSTPILSSRGYPSNCTSYHGSGGALCLDRPSDCTATYTAQPGDNCHSIPEMFGNFTASILYYWNPDIGRSCTGIRAYVPLCINTPWYHFQRPVEQPGGTIETPAHLPATKQPVPLAGRTWDNCTKYEMAGNGYYEYNMKQQNGFTDEEFCKWNQGVDCSNPQVQEYYWYAVAC